MRILLAPDKFKGSLPAHEVAAAISRGIHAVDPLIDLEVLPIADGGDGTVAAFARLGHHLRSTTCADAAGNPHPVAYAHRGTEAVVEIASTCGLALPGTRRTTGLSATSLGLGQIVADAVEHGATRIIVGLGGSASTDGGAGFLTGLGAHIADRLGHPVRPGAAGLADAATCDLTPALDKLRGVQLVFAADVNNPLCGAQGTAAVYGPQKGLSPHDTHVAAQHLENWADLIAATTGHDHRHTRGAGAAGGVGFAGLAVGGHMESGAELVLRASGARERLAAADLVITGEGSLDHQTLQGKGPGALARLAADTGAPAIAVCGRSTLDPGQTTTAGFAATYCLTDLEPDPEICIRAPGPLLERIGALIARLMCSQEPLLIGVIHASRFAGSLRGS